MNARNQRVVSKTEDRDPGKQKLIIEFHLDVGLSLHVLIKTIVADHCADSVIS
jgi:hypothetical protein